MYVNATRCLKCDDVIYPRAYLDMRFCECGTIAVSGGLKHYKVLAFNTEDYESVPHLYVSHSYGRLSDDMCSGNNKLGVVKWGRLKRSKVPKPV